MLRIPAIVLASIAAFALGICGSASAKEGVFKDGTEEAAIGYKFTGSTGKFKPIIGGEGTIECAASAATGEVTTATHAEAKITFTGCQFAGLKCKTSGAKAEEIVTTWGVLTVLDKDPSTGVYKPALLVDLATTTVQCSTTQTLVLEGGFLTLLPAAAGEPTGWLGTSGLKFTQEIEAAETEKDLKYRLTESGAEETTGLFTTGTGTKEFTKAVTAFEAEARLTFEKAVSIHA